MSEPIVLFLKSKECSICILVSKIWSEAVENMKKVYPNIRVEVLSFKDNTGSFDFNVYPKSISKFSYPWFPQFLLVPGHLWDEAMANLGPNNKIDLKNGTQVLNGTWNKDVLEYDGTKSKPKYNIRDPTTFGVWLKDALENPEFIKYNKKDTIADQNNMKNIKDIIVPTKDVEKHSSKERKNKHDKKIGSSEICSIKIISRR